MILMVEGGESHILFIMWLPMGFGSYGVSYLLQHFFIDGVDLWNTKTNSLVPYKIIVKHMKEF